MAAPGPPRSSAFTTSDIDLATEPLGIALPAGSPLFANLVQNYLNTLE